MSKDDIERFYKKLNISPGEKMHDGGIYDSSQYMEHGVYKKYSFLKHTPVIYFDRTSNNGRKCDAQWERGDTGIDLSILKALLTQSEPSI